jgi:glycosyltransferase involved in cell wall biosynthesis
MYASGRGKLMQRGRLVVAVLTHRRLEYLRLLLEKCALLRAPDSFDIEFLVVDNDPDASARDVVSGASMPWRVEYMHEPRRGIPVARNKALQEALKRQADLLCFIDDDEYPDPLWLTTLVSTWQNSGAHLVGGPVEIVPVAAEASPWQRFVNASLSARMKHKNKATAAAAASGRRFTVVTNNWLGDLAYFAREGLVFDETLLLTGGEDTKFFAEARQRGARVAWAADAMVYESMPPQRLTLRYQMKRAAMQSMQNFRFSWPRITAAAVAQTAFLVPLRLLSGTLLMIVPIYGIASPVVAVRAIGWAFGRIAALFGRTSTLYG